MARRAVAAPAVSAPGTEPASVEAGVEVEAPEGPFDLEQWVADVYDYQYNGGPAPVRKYLSTPEAPTAP